MKHYGDITAISGYDVPSVDVVIGGSPCQDLSIAGKRAGLAGERSGLFMEQIRLVKEIRNADIRRRRTGMFIRPRFMVWENVPGAFSSNRGEDFRSVLEETIRIAEPDAPDIPLPPKWPMADAWFGDHWSVAYRVLDAQFWGVPQRRRRIALVADFGGHAAPEILFVRKSGWGDIAEGKTAGEEIAAGAGSGTNRPIWCLQGNGIDRADNAGCNGCGWKPDVSYTLNTIDRHAVCQHGIAAGFKPHAGAEAGSIGYEAEKSPTIDTGKPMAVYDARGHGNGKTACTITGDHQSRVTDYTCLCIETGQANAASVPCYDLSPTLNCNHEQPIIAKSNDAYREDMSTYPVTNRMVRRLTPLECERLQGYPDGWTDIGPWTDSNGRKRECSDSARYKALGNSIALPPWSWVLKRLCACYERSATMASLFDGIGGFPLIWERLNGPGSCLWASEIEEFPIAVTQRRFGAER